MKSTLINFLTACLFIVSLACISGGCGNSNDPTPAVTPPTSGNVIPTLVDGAVVQFNQIETGVDSENEVEKIDPQFNSSGQLISLTSTRQLNNISNGIVKCTFTYTVDGFLSDRKITVDYDVATGLGQYVSTEKFEYQNSRLIKASFTKNRDVNFKTVTPFTIVKYYQYNASGKLTQYRNVDQDGQEAEREEYGYDGNNKISSYKEYVKGVPGDVDYVFADGFVTKRTVRYQGKISFINEYTYDGNGQNIEYSIMNAAGVVSSYWTITYDDKKAPLNFASNFFFDFGFGLGFDYLLFKGHPESPFSPRVTNRNILSLTDSNPQGRQYKYTYQYNAQGYPIESTYSVYNGTKKTTIEGKRTYSYFR